MTYRCIATSPAAFVRQIAASYLPHGYNFYVTGHVPDRYVAQASELDRRMVEKFDVNISKACRSKRRSEGIASVRYIRYERFWLLLSTHGKHIFFEQHRHVEDIRRRPVTFHGYEIRLVADKPRVRIERQEYRRLNGYLLDICTRPRFRATDKMALAIRQAVHFDPYSEVIKQFGRLMRQVNRRRRSQGLLSVPLDMVKLRRPKLQGPRMTTSVDQTELAA